MMKNLQSATDNTEGRDGEKMSRGSVTSTGAGHSANNNNNNNDLFTNGNFSNLQHSHSHSHQHSHSNSHQHNYSHSHQHLPRQRSSSSAAVTGQSVSAVSRQLHRSSTEQCVGSTAGSQHGGGEADSDEACPPPRVTPYERLSHDLSSDQRIIKEITLGRRIAFYRIRGEIGSGNFSQVKLGIHALTKGEFLVEF